MFKISLKNLLADKRRLIGTCSAVLLGVAFLSGTLVLGDTMRNGFDQVFATANAGTDVIVRASTVVGSDDLEQRGTVDPRSSATSRPSPGVDARHAVHHRHRADHRQRRRTARRRRSARPSPATGSTTPR